MMKTGSSPPGTAMQGGDGSPIAPSVVDRFGGCRPSLPTPVAEHATLFLVSDIPRGLSESLLDQELAVLFGAFNWAIVQLSPSLIDYVAGPRTGSPQHCGSRSALLATGRAGTA